MNSELNGETAKIRFRVPVGILSLMLCACGHYQATKNWHPSQPVKRYNAEPWGVTFFPPPKVDADSLKKIHVGDSENTIRSIIGEYPASWKQGSALLTEKDGNVYEVAYLYSEGTGFIKDISYKLLKGHQVADNAPSSSSP